MNNTRPKNNNTRRPIDRRNNNNKKKAMKSSINPDALVKHAVQTEIVEFKATSKFSEYDLQQGLLNNIAAKGYEFPTQIQEESIQHLLKGRDLIGIANTGTGKTGSFLIPIIEQLMKDRQQAMSLIVVPTRELALQVEDEFKSLTKGMNLYSDCFIGGTNVDKDIQKLRKRNPVVIGTPGRLIDMINRGALRLSNFSILVLDEFDRMLDMGFINDVKLITSAMKNRRQTMLFSATIEPNQKSLINELVKNPIEVKVSSGTTTNENIDQDIIKIPTGSDKFEMLVNLISPENFKKVLLFAETKRQVDRVTKKLLKSGIKTDQIHGNKSQNYRNTALNKFKTGKIQVLVATDVAARGLDVDDITHVINYQMPMTYDSYVHRIGRTGRAGKKGQAFTFVD